MSLDSLFMDLENKLAKNPDLIFWWREDDIAYIKPFHPIKRLHAYKRLKFIIRILESAKIPAILAVEPYKFIEKATPVKKLLDNTSLPIAIHGLLHKNFAKKNEQPSEFPSGREGTQYCEQILAAFKKFRSIYGVRVLPIFVPPYNNMTESLVARLNQNGIIVSVKNYPESGLFYSKYNVDFDFVDWQKRELLPYDAIIAHLIRLLDQNPISLGINGHHKIIKKKDEIFIERLIASFSKFFNKDYSWLNTI